MTGNNVKAVIFDWGGVLIDNPATAIVSYCCNALNVLPKDFEAAFRGVEREFQKGTITEEQYWKAICEQLHARLPEKRSLWGDALRHAYHPKQEMFDLAHRIRSNGVSIALLSNTEMPAVDIYHERHEGLFDVVVLSCLENTRKPEPEIYNLTLERLGVRAEETIFIDDRIENIEGAKRVGMEAILFISSSNLMERLRSYAVRL